MAGESGTPLLLPDAAMLERLDFETPCDGRDCGQPAAWWVQFTRCQCGRHLILLCAWHHRALYPILRAGARWQCTICGAFCLVESIGKLP